MAYSKLDWNLASATSIITWTWSGKWTVNICCNNIHLDTNLFRVFEILHDVFIIGFCTSVRIA